MKKKLKNTRITNLPKNEEILGGSNDKKMRPKIIQELEKKWLNKPNTPKT